MLDGVEDEPVDPTMVNMPLATLLQMVGYMSESEAQKISESVVKSATDLAGIEDDTIRKEFTDKLTLLVNPDSASGAIHKNSPIEENSMPIENKTPEEVEALVKSAKEAQAELETAKEEIETLKKSAEDNKDLVSKVESLEKASEDRILKSFNAVAADYNAYGADEETGKVLKAVSGLEGGDKVLEMLKNMKEAISKSELLDEVGTSVSDDSTDEYSKLEAIAKTLMSEDASLTHAQAIVNAASQPKTV